MCFGVLHKLAAAVGKHVGTGIRGPGLGSEAQLFVIYVSLQVT